MFRKKSVIGNGLIESPTCLRLMSVCDQIDVRMQVDWHRGSVTKEPILRFADSSGLSVRADQVSHPDRAGLNELTLHLMQMKYRIRLWMRMEQATEGSPVHLVQALSTDG